MSEQALTLPSEWFRDEKYADVLWISTNDGGEAHEVWIEVEDSRWLYFSILPMNYPAVGVSTTDISRETLAAVVHHNCVGWSVARDGGVLEDFLRLDEDGCIISIEEIEEVDPD